MTVDTRSKQLETATQAVVNKIQSKYETSKHCDAAKKESTAMVRAAL
jgi:hypothetical protein